MKTTLILGLILSASTSVHASEDRWITNCHLKMADGTRYEITLPAEGESMMTPMGRLIRKGNSVSLDPDVKVVYTGARKDFPFIDQSGRSFIPEAWEVLLKKESLESTLVCIASAYSTSQERVAGIQQVESLPKIFDQDGVLYNRAESYYSNPSLAGFSGSDTASMQAFMMQNWSVLLQKRLEKFNLLKDDFLDVTEKLIQKLGTKEMWGLNRPTVSNGDTKVTVDKADSQQVVLHLHDSRNYKTLIQAETIGYLLGFQDDFARHGNLDIAVPPVQVLEKQQTRDVFLRLSTDSKGRIHRSARYRAHADGQVNIWYAESFHKAALAGIPRVFMPDQLGQLTQALGDADTQIALQSQQVDQAVQLSPEEESTILAGYVSDLGSNRSLEAAKTLAALKASGLEDGLQKVTMLNLLRSATAQEIRYFAGLPESQASVDLLNAAISEEMKGMKVQTLPEAIAKTLYLDPMAVAKEINKLLKIDMSQIRGPSIKTAIALARAFNAGNLEKNAEAYVKWVNTQKIDVHAFYKRLGAGALASLATQGLDAKTAAALDKAKGLTLDFMMSTADLITIQRMLSGKTDDVTDKMYAQLNDQISKFVLELNAK